jgi:hypothetical protein
MFYLTPPRHISTLPKTDLTAPKSNFRFNRESGLRADIAPGPFRARTDSWTAAKPRCYSITSSARTNSIGGKVGLSALLRSGWERTDRRLSPSGFFAK